MKAVVAAFNQEKALVGAFSVITNLWMELFEALPGVEPGDVLGAVRAPVVQPGLQRHAVGQPVRDGEAAAALQLGQHDDHLSAAALLAFVDTVSLSAVLRH